MRQKIRALFAVLLLGIAPALQAAVSVFACEPEWAALAEAVGGGDVDVYAATTARQDPHYVEARPSLIARLRGADMLVCTGAGLEAGWLPVVLRQARNAAVQPGAPGHIAAADHVTKLEVPDTLDRAEGDIHPEGNPHIQTNPRNLLTVAGVLADRLASLDPNHADDYRRRLEEFRGRWQAAIARWEQMAAPLRGVRVVVHHREWIYLLDWLGMERAAALEPKPGVPPSAGYLADLRNDLAARPAAFIIRSPLADERPSHWLAAQTGMPEVVLPQTVGATDDAGDLFAWFDALIARLTGATR